MAFAFQKKSAAVQTNKPNTNQGSSNAPKGSAPPKGFLKTGKQAAELAAHEEQARELRKSMSGKTFRFRLKDGEERKITFLDGDLDEIGMLTSVAYYEHNVKQGQTFLQIACVAEADSDTECPLCKQGTFPQYFASAFTIIDHTPYTIQNGPNAGKTVTNTRRLFVCKHDTYKQLTKLAGKRGGLAGCTFDVSRSGQKSASVGNIFDFVEKIEDGEELMAKYGLKEDELSPLNYEDEIVYLPPAEMIQAGLGVEVHGHGTTKLGKETAVSEQDYQNEL